MFLELTIFFFFFILISLIFHSIFNLYLLSLSHTHTHKVWLILMLMKGKQRNIWMNTKNLNPYPCMNMERAFAQDAGGCMWPPRSYTCGFCRREFTSAQALGGHMNVHRRDRAMLSQSLNPSYLFSAAHTNSSPPPSRVSKVEDSTTSRFDVGTDLSVGLNCSASTGDSMLMRCKRPRLAVSPSTSPLLKPCFQGVEMMSSMEDLDLELRLGHDPPQVK